MQIVPAKTAELIPAVEEPSQEPPRGRTREKWLALVAFVVVTTFAVAVLYPK